MDVIMPRDDYEQLIAHFDKWRTSKNYALTFCRNDTSVYQFVKIIDTRTSVKERYVSASYKTGVWVDIFPLDGIPKDAKRVFRRNARLTASLALALSDPSNGTTPLRKLAKKLLDPIAKRMDPAHYSRLIDDNAHHCEKDRPRRHISISSQWPTPILCSRPRGSSPTKSTSRTAAISYLGATMSISRSITVIGARHCPRAKGIATRPRPIGSTAIKNALRYPSAR